MSGRLAAITGTLMILGAAAAATAIYLPGSAGNPGASAPTIGSKAVVADGLGRTVANGVGLAIGAIPRVKATGQARSTAGSHASSGHVAASSKQAGTPRSRG